MPSYIELDKQGSFAPSSDASKVILGINNDNLLQLTNSSGQSMSVAGLPYQVYTALLTQNGVSDEQYINIGELTIGVTYYINQISTGMDFTNVGAPNNNYRTYFVATGTTPNSWGDGAQYTLRYDNGAPVVKVLENTIGNIWFTYDSEGGYLVNCSGLFIPEKTIYFVTNINSADFTFVFATGSGFPNYLNLLITDITFNPRNSLLDNAPIEIRVYN